MLDAHPLAERNREEYKVYSAARRDWDIRARADIDFAILGNHYTPKESAELAGKGQADPTVDRLGAGVQKLVSLLTARPPGFRFIGREMSDSKMAYVWSEMAAYCWDISEGSLQSKQAIQDSSVTGMGYLFVYFDPKADYYKGQIKVTFLDPFRVYPSPHTRLRFFDDAPDIILSTILPGSRVIQLFPQYGRMDDKGKITGKIKDIDPTNESDYPGTAQTNTTGGFTPDELRDKDPSQFNYHLLERFVPVEVPFYRVVEGAQEEILSGNDLSERLVKAGYAETPAKAQELMDAVDKAGERVGNTEWVAVPQTRIRHIVTLGQILVRDEVLNTDIYPIIPLPNIWTNTAQPLSDVSKARDPQLLLDRLWSLILSHAQASIGSHVLLPEGSVDDVEAFAQNWSNPFGFDFYNSEFGIPVVVPPTPLATEFYHLMNQLSSQIDFLLGIPELLHGFTDKAPDTLGQTRMAADLAQGRPRSKLQDILAALGRVGKVFYNYSKAHYSAEKILQIVQANHDIEGVEKGYYDDKMPTVEEIEKDRLIGQYDVKILSDSILPHDPWAEYKLYLEANQILGVPSKFVIRKFPELFDAREIVEEMDENAMLKQSLEQAQQVIKDLQGNLQTAERESVQSRKLAITSRFESKMNKILNKVNADIDRVLGQLEAGKQIELANLRADLEKIKVSAEEVSKAGEEA